MRNVLLLIKGLGRGGAEQLLLSAIRHGDRSRFRYDVAYLLPYKDDLVPEIADLDAGVRCLGGQRDARWPLRLRRLVQEGEVDLVHAHSPVAAIGARIALPGRVRIVYTEHNMWPRYHPATYWGNAMTFPRNDHVFAVSDAVRDSVRYPRALGRLRMPPVETLYHGPDPAAVARLAASDGVREEFAVPQGSALVGTVAHLKPHKGHRHLLAAAVEIRRALGDVRFVLVGRGPLENDLRAQVHELGLDEAVVFTGFRDDALRLARGLDVFVLPSEFEGLPIALIEAMSLGRPVVVTGAGGNAEVVRSDTDGLVVPAGDPHALAGAVIKMLSDAGLRERLGRAARLRAADFDIHRAVERVETVYEELLA